MQTRHSWSVNMQCVRVLECECARELRPVLCIDIGIGIIYMDVAWA